MAQYKIGTVSVTNGSATVTGSGTAWLTEVQAGDIFSVIADNVTYNVGSVASNTSLTLTAPYTGASGSGKTYTIVRDFTTNYSYPLLYDGDVDLADIISRAFNAMDADIKNAETTVVGASLDNLTDVDTTGLNLNDILKYNGTNFVPAANTLGSLGGVNLTGVALFNLLMYDGTNFVPVASTIGNLSNVDTTGLASGNILRYNGTNFVPAAFDIALDTTPTLGGQLDATLGIDSNGGIIREAKLVDYRIQHQTVAVAGGALSINLSLGNSVNTTLSSNITSLTFSNVPATGLVEIKIVFTQDATGSRTATWPTSLKWPGGIAVPLSTAANAVDVLYLSTYNGGTTWLANMSLSYS